MANGGGRKEAAGIIGGDRPIVGGINTLRKDGQPSKKESFGEGRWSSGGSAVDAKVVKVFVSWRVEGEEKRRELPFLIRVAIRCNKGDLIVLCRE